MTDLTIEEIKTGNVKVRAGYDTRVLATDLGGSRPVCIAFKGNSGWRVVRLTENGKQTTHQCHDHDYDLVLIPQAQYFNVYEELDGSCLIADLQDDIRDALTEAQEYSFKYVSFETFQYLDGEITKVEESSNAD